MGQIRPISIANPNPLSLCITLYHRGPRKECIAKFYHWHDLRAWAWAWLQQHSEGAFFWTPCTSAVIIGKNNQREAAINVSPPAEQPVCQPERWSLTYFIRLIIHLIHDRLDTLSWSILIVEPNYNKDSFDCWTKITIDNSTTMVDLNCWHFVHGEDIDCGYLLR